MGNAIRKAARMQGCSLRLRGCRNDPEMTVLAHLNCVDKGMGFKSPDWWAVFACSNCHDIIDGRKQTDMSHEDVDHRILYGLYETQKELIRLGHIIIKGKDNV